MIIRPATAKDIPQLIQFLHDFVAYYKENNIISPELSPFEVYKDKDAHFKKVAREYLDKRKYTFVAEDNGKLVGYICGLVEERASRTFDRKGTIEDWFVTEKYRNIGVGKKLLEALVQKFKAEKCTHLYITAFASHRETIGKYHKMGFIDMDLTMVREI